MAVALFRVAALIMAVLVIGADAVQHCRASAGERHHAPVPGLHRTARISADQILAELRGTIEMQVAEKTVKDEIKHERAMLRNVLRPGRGVRWASL